MELAPALESEIQMLLSLRHSNPHSFLGIHPCPQGVCVRAFRPDAIEIILKPDHGGSFHMTHLRDGLFELILPEKTEAFSYSLEVTYPHGATFTLRDPYSFWPTLGELDLHLAQEGRHERLWEKMGAHIRNHQGVHGVSFAVWAPQAVAVSVVGDFNSWDGRLHPMRSMGQSGLWELFLPEVSEGARYKFEVHTAAGGPPLLKADPFAFRTEVPPQTASIVSELKRYVWRDEAWMKRNVTSRPLQSPLSIYEVHLGSWKRKVEEEGRSLTYRELASELVPYVKAMGFTHVELLPVAEHPFGGSWGYQVGSYFSPTARFGHPDDLRFLIDSFHRAGIGVIVDWVPAHFPKDAYALATFDGSCLYEHQDPRLGAHPDWGTLIFNYGRNEVRNFLLANALFWLEEYHVDGLRVDAVASMLYRDYSRAAGEWVPNRFGGRENEEAMSFLRELNSVVAQKHPHAMMIAEESTAWPGVSRPVSEGGLGFTFKWNMGWMHDTLTYFSKEPVHRKHHHNQLTFGLLYAFSEHFILPLSHDEVVHGKGSLWKRMPNDAWQKFANLRALYGWMWAHPGKKLLFMGDEFAQMREWNHNESLDWHLMKQSGHQGVSLLVGDLNRLYCEMPSLFEKDDDSSGFQWILADSANENVLAFVRKSEWHAPVVCAANLSPVPRENFRIGVPTSGTYKEVLNTDAQEYGGSGVGNLGRVEAAPQPFNDFPASMEVTLPPLAVVWFVPEA